MLVIAVIAAATIDVHWRCRQIVHHLREIKRLRRELREQRGLSVEAIAVAAGIADTELEAIESGRLDPGYRRLRRLATALGVTSTALLRIEEIERRAGGEA